MVMLGGIALLCNPLLLPLVSVAAEPPTDLSLTPLESLEAANRFFMFRGEPINPRAVGDLLPWLSDMKPGSIALDVEGSMADTNRYWAEVENTAIGTVRATWEPWLGEEISYTTGYRWLGQLDNGLHILRVTQNTGGSGVFTSLLFVRFLMDTEYFYVDGPGPRPRLIMKRMGSYGLGNRDSRNLWLEGNVVVIEAGEHTEEIRIDLTGY
ncbi:MAG: hypothetical protein AAF821_04830 [Cyanobacteria bacterium P01_D01_bin.156]